MYNARKQSSVECAKDADAANVDSSGTMSSAPLVLMSVAGCAINCQNDDGFTALDCAASHGSTSLVGFLLQNGNAFNDTGPVNVVQELV